MKRIHVKILIALTALITGFSFCCAPGTRATTTTDATGALISLSTAADTVKKGEVFTIVCRVMAATGVFESDFYVDYNTSVLEFVEGGSKAQKETGGVHIQSVDNTDTPTRRTFSLQFLAKQNGDATVFIRDGAHVMDGEGNALSVRTNRLELLVNETGEPDPNRPDDPEQPYDPNNPAATGDPGATDNPAPPGQPPANASGNCRIKSLTTNATEMVPAFDPSVLTYDAIVDSQTETFFIDYVLADKTATARIRGNKNLSFGENRVKLIVTAPNGKKRTYMFLVTRPEAEEPGAAPDTVSPAAVAAELPLDKESETSYSIVLYVIIALLSILSISLIILVRRQRHEIDNFIIEEEEREQKRETENDLRSREGDIERREIRGEDGQFRYRD